MINTKFKRGDVRDDGMVFWCYEKMCKNGERWFTKEKYDAAVLKKTNTYSNWYSLNKEKKKINYHNYYFSNLEKERKRNKIWRQNNPDKIRKKENRLRKSNPEKYRKKVRDYFSKNPHINSAKASKRRASVRNSFLMLHRDQESIIKTIYQTCVRLSKCLGIKHNVDHIYPISKGGYHIHTNMQILPATINFRKGKKMPYQFSIA
jgi:hypothetical protein